MFSQVVFIVWRESVEALLVIGILHAWINHNATDTPGLRYLWSGVASGIAAAVALALVLVRFSSVLVGEEQEYFQAGLVLFAGVLIVQMVFWMRRRGRTLKRELEGGLSAAATAGRWWGVFLLALLAVAREGSETVVFLYGSLAAGQSSGTGGIWLAIVAGFALAALTYGLLQLGQRYLSWHLFFRVTETMLLLLASALFVSGVGYLVSFGLIPYTDALWDTGWLLDDISRLGGLVAALTGYRAQPDLATVSTWIVFWSAIFLVLRWQDRDRSAGELSQT